jgi:hypothetical protein
MEPTNTNVRNTGAGLTGTGQNLPPGTRDNQVQNQPVNRGQTQNGASLSGPHNQATPSEAPNTT